MKPKSRGSNADKAASDLTAKKSATNVLIIEDDIDQALLLRAYLEPHGATVTTTDDPTKAVRLAEGLQPDIILLDAHLYGADGHELCRRLKENTLTYGIPVIFISAQDDGDARVRGLRAGAVDYLVKPLLKSELLERVRIHLRGRRMHRKLKRKVLELRSARDTLETRVMERTAALQDSLEKVRDLYNNAPCGYHSLNADGVIVQINETELRWLGYKKEEVLGKMHFADLLDSKDRLAFPESFATLKREGQVRDVEYEMLRKDGSIMPVLLSATVITDVSGQFVMTRGTIYDISERRRAEDRIRFIAHHDSLTGLLNRMAFQNAAEQRLREILHDGGEATVLFIDLDNFKNINDSLGHHVGDKVIIAVAQRLQLAVDSCDVIARLGGDEFVILLEAPEARARAVAQQVLASMSRPVIVDTHELHAGATVGISVFPRDGNDIETLMRSADTAMYAGKRRQRGCLEVFTPTLAEQAALKLSIASQLPVALERKQLFVQYQPQIDLQSGRVVAVEGLIRWRHPVLGLVPPEQFISIAEDSGAILDIGEWVLRTACEALRGWQATGHGEMRMAVNVSVKQLQTGMFANMVEDMLRQHRLHPSSIEIELTESLFLEHAEENIRNLIRLADSGVQVAIDDFGVGYSGLGYLSRLPLHTLKIDRSFIGDVGESFEKSSVQPIRSAGQQPIAAAIISMAKTLNLNIVAEGVEIPEQVQFLRDHGCYVAQGFYFAKPMSKEELKAFLDANRNDIDAANKRSGSR